MKKTKTWLVNLLFGISLVIVCLVLSKIFLFVSFYVPTNSMEPAIKQGDYVLVNKLIPGPRLFNIFATLHLKQTNIYRPLGLKKLQHNDVVVFNNPYPRSKDTLELHILNYFLKRCIGLPGDSLQIINGIYQVKGFNSSLGNREAQKQLGLYLKNSPQNILNECHTQCYPNDSTFSWDILNFGTLYIPKTGDNLSLTYQNYILYHKLIEWEEKSILEYHDSTTYLNHKPIQSYTFKKNYYFMAGDYSISSNDSRYWGLVPEEYIVGKVCLIWKSVNIYNNHIRWKRFMKRVR